MATNIDIIINAQDKSKAAFDKAQSGMSSFKSKIEGMQPTFQKMAGYGTVAFAGIAAFAGAAINEAREAEKVTASLNAVLESTKGVAGVTADAVNELADSIAKTSLFEDDAIKNSQALLLTFTKVGKDVFPQATQAIVDMSAKMGTDLQGSTIQLGKALNDPIGGIASLSRVGVQFTQDQKDMIAKMVESGDVVGAQTIILKELETQFGGTAKAMAEADPFGMMKKSIDEAKESIGAALLPALTALLEHVTPLIEKFSAWAAQNPELLSKILLIGGAVAGLVAVMGAIGMILPVILTGFTLLLSPIGLLIATIVIIILKWKEFKQMWIDAWEGIKSAAKAGADAIMSFLKPVFDFVKKIIDGIDKAVSFVGDKLGGGKKKKVNDAVIDPSGDIVETNPRDWVIATQNPGALFGGQSGAGVVVNINGGTYLDDGVANKIGDVILERLQFNMRGA